MPCPHLKEVVMLYCDAFPVKKMVPLDRLVSADPCLTCNYERCPIYVQRAKAAVLGDALPEPAQLFATRKEY
jgi:hypothetical protein